MESNEEEIDSEFELVMHELKSASDEAQRQGPQSIADEIYVHLTSLNRLVPLMKASVHNQGSEGDFFRQQFEKHLKKLEGLYAEHAALVNIELKATYELTRPDFGFDPD